MEVTSCFLKWGFRQKLTRLRDVCHTKTLPGLWWGRVTSRTSGADIRCKDHFALFTLAQVSFSVAVRLKTSLSGVLSVSTQK